MTTGYITVGMMEIGTREEVERWARMTREAIQGCHSFDVMIQRTEEVTRLCCANLHQIVMTHVGTCHHVDEALFKLSMHNELLILPMIRNMGLLHAAFEHLRATLLEDIDRVAVPRVMDMLSTGAAIVGAVESKLAQEEVRRATKNQIN